MKKLKTSNDIGVNVDELVRANTARHANGTIKERLQDCLFRARTFASVGRTEASINNIKSAKSLLKYL